MTYYMAIFEQEPKPTVTVKQMTAMDGLRYQYYAMGDSAKEAKSKLRNKLYADAKELYRLADIYHAAADGFYDVQEAVQ